MTIYDGMALVGLMLLGVGLWLIAPALSLSVVGTLLLTGGVLGARQGLRSDGASR